MNKSFILLCSTMFLILMLGFPMQSSSPTGSEYDDSHIMSQEFTPARILFDESHTSGGSDMWTPGNASMFGWILGVNGYNCTTNWELSLDSGILENYDILCLFFPQIPLTSNEVEAIHEFVSSGGGLLLVGTDESHLTWQYTPSHLNPISEVYGIEFNEDSVLGVSEREKGHISEHDVTYNINYFHSHCDQLRGCTLKVESPAENLATIKDSDILAVAQEGDGRVAAIGTPTPFIIYRHGKDWQKYSNDHFQFSLNLIDWLAGNAPRIVDIPEISAIRIGSGPELEVNELDEYTAFNGVYHDHTTVSDGRDSPLDMMATALYDGLDYFLVADHSYNVPASDGICGALAVHRIQQYHGLDCAIFIGAELSSIPHTVGFPLTENINTNDIQTAVDSIHAQSGFAILAHPTLTHNYALPWEAFDDYGYDAFEVSCRGFFHCIGESCYSRPFIASNDGHSAEKLDFVRAVAYVKDPTGPNGTISVHDLIDAILDYRIVILDRYNKVVLGKGVWVDKFLDEWDEAKTLVENTRNQIEQLEREGRSLGLSRIYIEDAERFLSHWNPTRAIRAAHDAISDFTLDFDIDVTFAKSGVFTPNDEVSLLINLTNAHPFGVQINETPFICTSIEPHINEPYQHILEPYHLLQVGPESSKIITLNGLSSNYGYIRGALNFKDFNITNAPASFIIRLGGIISNISVDAEQEGGQNYVAIRLLTSRGDSAHISSAQITYDDGSVEQTTQLENYGDGYGIILGPYTTGTNITYHLNITDKLRNSFIIDGGTYQIELTPLGPEIWLSAIIGLGLIGLLTVVIIIVRRRRIPEV